MNCVLYENDGGRVCVVGVWFLLNVFSGEFGRLYGLCGDFFCDFSFGSFWIVFKCRYY